jgi:hypothetical protein
MSDPVRDLKHELLAAAERQQGHAPAPASRRRWRAHPGRNRLLLTAATLAIATAVALLFTAPWDRSHGFLARAEAALTPPAGTVLHMKWQLTTTSTDPACTVTHDPSEMWIDQTPPHRYRALLNNLPDIPVNATPRALACSSGKATELGGAIDTRELLTFLPPNKLTVTVLLGNDPPDPVPSLRNAIRAGRAHDEGKTQLGGRTVERIRIDPSACPPLANCPREPSYAYVDPETFYPVETVGPGIIGPAPCNQRCDGVFVRLQRIRRYLTFEYLPRTAANLALTDIHAQHPNATGP